MTWSVGGRLKGPKCFLDSIVNDLDEGDGLTSQVRGDITTVICAYEYLFN